MKITVFYHSMKFIFETSDDGCWYDLDHKEAVHGKYKITINADRDVYALLEYDDKKIEGYIIENDDHDKCPIADNYPINNINYHFIRLKRPGYYL